MKIFSPVGKVVFGLVMLTVSLVLAAEWIGIVPNEQRGFVEGRRILGESLAVQLSGALAVGQTELVDQTLSVLVERDENIISAGIIRQDGYRLIIAGPHGDEWSDHRSNRSTPTHVTIPIFDGERRWGALQIVFTKVAASSIPFDFGIPLLPLILFLMLAGFVAFRWFIKRTLKELDPSSVVPERVKSAFDALAEGLVIIDEKENIVLANQSFAEKISSSDRSLIGTQLSTIDWEQSSGDSPWKMTLDDGQRETGTTIRFTGKNAKPRTFTVNSTPIADGRGALRGALVTFNDLTDLERKQIELKNTVAALETSRSELQKKTVELEFLATRDSLTGCLNRRAFFEKAEFLFMEARQRGGDLACIMCDIDHFKRINDGHGHATGDKVIQMVSGQLRSNARPDDVVGRYGGEEFCIILPKANLEAAMQIGERLRTTIKEGAINTFESKIRVTASFGVALIDDEIGNPADLIARADKALYDAKENGRNRVVSWHPDNEATESGANANALVVSGETGTDGDLPIAIDDNSAAMITALQERVSDLEREITNAEIAKVSEVGQDEVTGLPNRLLLLDRIRQAASRNERYDHLSAVIILDIDLFRRINDALGFVIGDQVLRKVADRLVEMLRETDTVSQLGGDPTATTVSRTGADEFGILITDLKNAEAATWIVKRLLDNMTEPFDIDNNEIFISCSAGISLFPLDADKPEQLIGNASIARYTAKRRLGRNNFAFFSEDLNHSSYRHLWLEGQMHGALESNEFALNFQPKVDLRTGRVTSFEGLLRWHNPKIGFVSPADFIPVAEHTGLINDIGRWVIEQGCRQVREWVDAGYTDIGVAVNLSPVQFRQADLADQIMSALDAADIAPSMLELEVTESVIMENFDESVETLKKLAEAGVRIAIDDFGTGYSSLAYLKNLPVNTLKIDRSFLSDTVPDEQDKQIITAIVALAHSMDLEVVAEGVETEAQRTFLKALACNEMQGYLFSKPVPADETLGILRDNDPLAPRLPDRKIA